MTSDSRLHFHSLIGAGWTLRSIAAHANAAPSRVRAWVAGEDIPSVELGVLAIPLDSLPTRTTHSSATPAGKEAEPFVPRVGTTRRLQALMRMGWPGPEISRRLNALGLKDKRAAENLLHQQGRWVTRSHHDAVATVYRDLSHLPGPSTRSRNRAEKKGYAGPLDWFDIDHDLDPFQHDEDVQVEDDIDDVAVERRMAGDRSVKLTKAERAALIDQWFAAGRPYNQLTGLGFNTDEIRAGRKRATAASEVAA